MKVVIIHRNAATGHGLALILEKYGDFQVVAEVSDCEEAIPAVLREAPEIVLVDSEFTGLDMEDTLGAIKESLPETSLVVLTGSDDWSHLETSIRAGAASFISMKTPPEELALCLRLVAGGHVFVASPLVSTLSDLVSEGSRDENGGVDHDLSERELEILNLVSHGATNQEISESLTIAENTVKVHMRNILGKLQLRNRQQAAAYALKTGLVVHEAEFWPSDLEALQ